MIQPNQFKEAKDNIQTIREVSPETGQTMNMVGVFDSRYLPGMFMQVARWGRQPTSILVSPRIFREIAGSEQFQDIYDAYDARDLAVKGLIGKIYGTLVYTDAFFGKYSVLAANEIIVTHSPSLLVDIEIGEEPDMYEVICGIDVDDTRNYCYGIITPEN